MKSPRFKRPNKRPQPLRPFRLHAERLEPRELLHGEGVVWGADARLTLSFAPDGTAVSDADSGLFAQMDRLGPRDAWQAEIVKGFQAWAKETNGDIGVVADSGDEFGVMGQMQRDPRFGDVRIGSIPLDDQLFAVSVSAAEVIDGTWKGDLLFNSNKSFESLDELFAVAMHEAGHVFGLDHSDDPNSPMHEHGIPSSVVPTIDDLTALHAVFGSRAPDIYELTDPNGSGNSSVIELPLNELYEEGDGTAPSLLFADITTIDDRDDYRFRAPEGYTGPVTIELVTSGISSLTPSITVANQLGTVLGAATSFSPSSDLSITLNGVCHDDGYMISVQSDAAGAFSIGGYSLLVWYDAINEVEPSSVEEFVRHPIRYLDADDLGEYFEDGQVLFANDDGGSDDDFGFELELNTTPGFAEGTRYQVSASIETVGDVDRYLVAIPDGDLAASNWGRVTLRSIDPGLLGTLRVFNDQLVEVPYDILIGNDESMVVQFGSIENSENYSLEIRAHEASLSPLGNYELHVQFGVAPIERETFVTKQLAHPFDADRHRLQLNRPQLFQWNFQVDPSPNQSTARLVMRIVNLRGDDFGSVEVAAGETRTMSTFLPSGRYRLVVTGAAESGNFQDLAYRLRGAAIDDPLGPQLNDPTVSPFDFDEDTTRDLVKLTLFFAI